MKYGYMPSFEVDLVHEIKFAKKYFNFIEITLQPELSIYTTSYINRIKSSLKNFEVIGHLYWGFDLSKRDF